MSQVAVGDQVALGVRGQPVPARPEHRRLGGAGRHRRIATTGATRRPASSPPPTTGRRIGRCRSGFSSRPPTACGGCARCWGGEGRLGLDELAALQRDVVASGALALRDALLARIGTRPGDVVVAALASSATTPPARPGRWLSRCCWPNSRTGSAGREDCTGSRRCGQRASCSPRRSRPPRTPPCARCWMPPCARRRALRRYRSWGAMHRMRLRHHLGALPLVGGRYALPAGTRRAATTR